MDKAEILLNELVKEAEAYEQKCQKEYAAKELEKIRAEIKEESYSIINIDGDFYDLVYRIVDIDDVNEIIDKHISELKGEQK